MNRSKSILDHYPDFEAVIGIEVHVQLNTKTKIFCACANETNQIPNTNICEVCTAQPGSLPVFNKEVIVSAIKAGLATNSTIAQTCTFDRKHYFYPDLPKDYQITQNYFPICRNGYVAIRLEDGTTKKIRLNRIHIEEDAGKNTHIAGSNESFVDFNRTGTPLLEIVTEPDISNSYEARAYLKALRAIVQYLQICSGNMEEGAFRADTNISIRKKGDTKLGTKCELKNINSFKFIGDATDYEIERQINLLLDGGKVRQETRLWDTKNKTTVVMRSKEEAADYRYFEDPDLPIITVTQELQDQIKSVMPELPYDKFDRYVNQLHLSAYEAEILLDDPELAHYYEQAASQTPSKLLINWILRDLLGYIKEYNLSLATCKITPSMLAELVNLIDKDVINSKAAQDVFAAMVESGKNPSILVKELGLEQIGSSEELEQIVLDVIAQNPQAVSDYKSGKEKLFFFLVGQTMQKTKGKGNPKLIQELMKKHLV